MGMTLEYRKECSHSDVVSSLTSPDSALSPCLDIENEELHPPIIRPTAHEVPRPPSIKNPRITTPGPIHYTHLLRMQADSTEILRGRTSWRLKKRYSWLYVCFGQQKWLFTVHRSSTSSLCTAVVAQLPSVFILRVGTASCGSCKFLKPELKIYAGLQKWSHLQVLRVWRPFVIIVTSPRSNVMKVTPFFILYYYFKLHIYADADILISEEFFEMDVPAHKKNKYRFLNPAFVIYIASMKQFFLWKRETVHLFPPIWLFVMTLLPSNVCSLEFEGDVVRNTSVASTSFTRLSSVKEEVQGE